ncbi:MAG: rod shape-determining protein [Firmicutes bacterium]|nr:rod shape-determining protein [Bacillota bacterium]
MLLSRSLAIDLGSSNTRVYSRGTGIVLNEPSAVAIQTRTREVIAVGNEAKEMIGRTPNEVSSGYPIRHGTVTDLLTTKAMFRYFLKHLFPRAIPFSRPRLLICIPYSLTDTERRVLVDVAVQAGFSDSGTHLLEQPVAAALASEMDVLSPAGNMVVDIGGGLTEVAIVSMGGVVTSRSIPIAGDTMNEEIERFVQREFNLMIGEHTSEQIKIRLANAYFDPHMEEEKMEIKGRDRETGLPRIVEMTNFQAAMAIRESVDAIVAAVLSTLEHTPPELSADIVENGMVMSGGGSLLRGLDRVLYEKTNIRVKLASDPMNAVANGAGIVLEDMKKYHSTLVPLRNLL